MQQASFAKLNMPRLARGIARPRLFKMLDEGRRAAATWIAAPGGAGKTTLAATYLIERKLPYLWYQLDQDDADPATFFYYLGIAARQALPGREIHLPLLTPEYLPDIPGFARRYFGKLFSLLPSDATLVLDNHHDVLDNPFFTTLLCVLIDQARAGRLLVMSRDDPSSELIRNHSLLILGWDSLRLTFEEARDIAIQSQELDDKVVQMLHQLADGWPAAITLLLEQHRGLVPPSLEIASPEAAFDFFAEEYFDGLPESKQDFLLKTALLTHISSQMAEAISGNKDAASILEDLHRRRLFTYRRDLEEASYQYHALFRTFLLSKLKEKISGKEYRELVRRAGEVLCQHARQEEAVGLCLSAQDWESAVPLLLEQAPALLSQGRSQILSGWIGQLPVELVAANPWLLYWKAIGQQFVHPSNAQAILGQAYVGFVGVDDELGQMLVASAMIDITYIVRQSAASTIEWIDVIQGHLKKQFSFPSPVVEARVLTSLVSMLMFLRPDDEHLASCAERLKMLLDEDMGVNQKVFMAGHLLYYTALIAGDGRLCSEIMGRIMPQSDAPELTVINQIFWRHMCMLPCWLMGEMDLASELALPILGLVDENNLQVLKFIVHFYEMSLHLQLGSIGTAVAIANKLPEMISAASPMDMAWHHWLVAWLSLLEGKYSSASRHALLSRQNFSECAAAACEVEMLCAVANACCESGKSQEALDYLVLVENTKYGNSPRLRYQVLLIKAYAHLVQGATKEGHRLLQGALTLGSSRGYLGNFLWFPRMMSRLCSEALRLGVEVEYVRQLILIRKLKPDDGVVAWPWPIRIFTMGQFKVEVDGQVNEGIQAKPSLLLAVLIAFGAAEIKVERVAEVLWPDAEGDAATSAFTTTVSRLRKLIGDEAIIVKGGRVTLDEDRCWVDVRALERRIHQVDALDAEGTGAEEHAAQLLDLYRGPFLNDEEWAWAAAVRRRVRENLARCLAGCVSKLQAAGQRDAAAALLERIAAIDPEVMARLRLFEET